MDHQEGKESVATGELAKGPFDPKSGSSRPVIGR